MDINKIILNVKRIIDYYNMRFSEWSYGFFTDNICIVIAKPLEFAYVYCK